MLTLKKVKYTHKSQSPHKLFTLCTVIHFVLTRLKKMGLLKINKSILPLHKTAKHFQVIIEYIKHFFSKLPSLPLG